MAFTIEPWSPSHSVEEITEMLHVAYGSLARQGMIYNASHQPASQTLARLNSGKSFVAIHTKTGQVIGTISVYESSTNKEHPYYRRDGLVYFGQFAVHPDFQGQGIAKQLYLCVEDYARSLGSTEIALDTAETANDLIATYRRWGFSIVDRADWESTNYVSVIMSKPL